MLCKEKDRVPSQSLRGLAETVPWAEVWKGQPSFRNLWFDPVGRSACVGEG